MTKSALATAIARILIILSGVSIFVFPLKHRFHAQKLVASSLLSHRLKKRVAKIFLMSLYCYVLLVVHEMPSSLTSRSLTREEASLKN